MSILFLVVLVCYIFTAEVWDCSLSSSKPSPSEAGPARDRVNQLRPSPSEAGPARDRVNQLRPSPSKAGPARDRVNQLRSNPEEEGPEGSGEGPERPLSARVKLLQSGRVQCLRWWMVFGCGDAGPFVSFTPSLHCYVTG